MKSIYNIVQEENRQFWDFANKYAQYQFEQLVLTGNAYVPTSFLKWEEDEEFKLWLEKNK